MHEERDAQPVRRRPDSARVQRYSRRTKQWLEGLLVIPVRGCDKWPSAQSAMQSTTRFQQTKNGALTYTAVPAGD